MEISIHRRQSVNQKASLGSNMLAERDAWLIWKRAIVTRRDQLINECLVERQNTAMSSRNHGFVKLFVCIQANKAVKCNYMILKSFSRFYWAEICRFQFFSAFVVNCGKNYIVFALSHLLNSKSRIFFPAKKYGAYEKPIHFFLSYISILSVFKRNVINDKRKLLLSFNWTSQSLFKKLFTTNTEIVPKHSELTQ